MNEIDFLEQLYEDLEIESTESLSVNTVFKNLEEWDSMTAMVLIGFINEKFNKNLNSDEIEECDTIADIIRIKELKLV